MEVKTGFPNTCLDYLYLSEILVAYTLIKAFIKKNWIENIYEESGLIQETQVDLVWTTGGISEYDERREDSCRKCRGIWEVYKSGTEDSCRKEEDKSRGN